MAGQKVLMLKNYGLPKDEGDYHRLLCLSGTKKGESFFLQADRIVIGRGNDTDIQVIDGKSSREHADLVKNDNSYIISDLGSQNGVVVNDLKVTQQKLRDGDKIVIGQTVFKYNIVNVNKKNLSIVKSPDTQSSIKKNEVNKDTTANNEEETENENKASKGLLQKFSALDNKTKIKIIAALGVLIFFFLMDDGQNVDQQKDAKKNDLSKGKDISAEVNSLIQKKKAQEDKELEKNLNVIFHRGLREASEGNYFRAISEFNLALILSPQNARASYYLGKTTQKLNDDINFHFTTAKRFKEALRFKAAVTEYCAILRLLENYPDDQRYKDAETPIKEIEKTMGMEEGEIKCISR
ncbi:MAG: FHA domain-containing protein [Oligoflexia bacterium]|nr:FHA domain-containing protein [Oligoflexia bacterium]